jgi:peptidoglycan/xylan/chitin deacetylase (PgdA/CDA1 family)
MARYALIRAALEALAASRAPKWLPAVPDAAGFVLTLHHVRPAQARAFDPNAILAVTPDFLDRLIAHLKQAGWQFVPVTELAGAHSRAGQARRLAVTLDDGFRNNLEHALPVFRRHAVPFTIYVCPGFCDRTAELWWEALDRIIASVDAIAAPGQASGKILAARSPGEKAHAFHAWRNWLTTDADETRQRQAIRALATAHGLDLGQLAGELVMDWDEIRAIAADPLCAIGAHTMTHPALARLPADNALREMTESADRIVSEIGVRPQTIAFPYGYASAAGAREAALASEAGFGASFTTRPGYVPQSGSRHGLPRISVNGLYQEIRYLEALLTPAIWKLKDRLRPGR